MKDLDAQSIILILYGVLTPFVVSFLLTIGSFFATLTGIGLFFGQIVAFIYTMSRI